MFSSTFAVSAAVAERLAEIRGETPEELAAYTYANAEKIYGLK